MIEHWRRITPEQRLRRAMSIGGSLNALICAKLRQDYPDATDREIQLRHAARSYPRELMIKAFGWDPVIKGY